MRALLLLAFAAALPGGAARAQSVADYVPPTARGHDFDLSIRGIMQAEANVGLAPAQVRWTGDGEWIYFQWQPGGLEWDAGRSTYRVSADGGTPERVADDEARRMAPYLGGGDLSPDRRHRIVSVAGDLYLVDRREGSHRRLTHTEDAEGQPLFRAGGAPKSAPRRGGLRRDGAGTPAPLRPSWRRSG